MAMPHIGSYSFGTIAIDNKTYDQDIVIFTDGKIEKRGLQKGTHLVCLEETKPLIEEKPEVIIIGTGQSGAAEIETETRQEIESRGIKLIEEPTPRAIQTYNKVKEKKAALFHLTC